MAWIESHQSLERHPKTLSLGASLGVPLDIAIGRLHIFWWWALDYALDGDLSKYTDEQVEMACKIPIKTLMECGFVDGDMKIHDWLYFAGRFIRIKYKNYPEKINDIFGKKNKGSPKNTPKNTPKTPNLTKPNLTNTEAFGIPEDLKNRTMEIMDWLEYKKQKGQSYKTKGLEALWRRVRGIPSDKLREAVDTCMSNNYSGLFYKNGNVEIKNKKEVIL